MVEICWLEVVVVVLLLLLRLVVEVEVEACIWSICDGF
jgi:hypothetical protein